MALEFDEGKPPMSPSLNPFDALNQKIHAPKEVPYLLSKREQVALAILTAMIAQPPIAISYEKVFSDADEFLAFSEKSKK